MNDIRLTYFTILWILADFSEFLIHPAWFLTVTGQLNIFALIFCACRPSSSGRFMFLAATFFIHEMLGPVMFPENNVYETMVNFNVLVILFFNWPGWYRGDLYLKIASNVRVYLIGFYFFAFLSKLNTDFLDPQSSCATAILGLIQKEYPGPWSVFLGTAWFKEAAVWGPVIFEGLACVLLIFRKTRHGIILAGIAFHVFLGLEQKIHLIAFSTLMLTLYFVFISDRAFAVIQDRGNKLNGFFKKIVPTASLRSALIALAIYLPLFLNFRTKDSCPLWFPLGLLIPFIYVWSILKAGVWTPKETRQETSLKEDFFPSPVFPSVLAVVLLLFNGFAPYLGIRSNCSLAPFSNLRILGPRPNHLIFNSSTVIFKQDMVRILDSDTPFFRQYAHNHFLFPVPEFRRCINRIPGRFFVRCLYQGREIIIHKTQKGFDQDFLTRAPGWLEQKFFRFWLVDEGEHCNCGGLRH